MTSSPPVVWTEMGSDDAPLCCICRIPNPVKRTIRWESKNERVNVHCWTCLDCWDRLGPDRRSAHRDFWRAVS